MRSQLIKEYISVYSVGNETLYIQMCCALQQKKIN